MKISRTIRIASRSSQLALWQANAVKSQLEKLGNICEIITVESTGDVELTKPIYSLGISGVFTKQLDTALLNKQVDIAVHSLKDVPTQLAQNLTLAAVLERGSSEDVVIIKDKKILDDKLSEATIASSSLRRRAQWLAMYPKHRIVPIRGNVQTRLRKLEEAKDINGVIMAKAGLERLNLLPEDAVTLDWMLPAPAQGIIGIVCREDDKEMKEVCVGFNHRNTFIEGAVERQFLRTLLGGCSVPISALAEVNGDDLAFHGAIHSFDGSKCFRIRRMILVSEWHHAGRESAEKLLQQVGASKLLEEIRSKKWDDESTFD